MTVRGDDVTRIVGIPHDHQVIPDLHVVVTGKGEAECHGLTVEFDP
jgi:hypothetical protein